MQMNDDNTQLTKLLRHAEYLKKNSKHGGSLYIEINPHRNAYESIEEYLRYRYSDDEDLEGEDKHVFERCEPQDSLVVIKLYTHTPIGFYQTFDCDLEKASERMNRILALEQIFMDNS